MKPTEFCNCICCTDCQYYTDCMENYIVSERLKGKYSFGKLKADRFPSIDDKEMKIDFIGEGYASIFDRQRIIGFSSFC